jgi:hypothetical protein
VTSRFDNRAALGFYRELSKLPPNFLVDSLPCPLFAFWGEDDEEIASAGGVQLLASALDRRSLKHASFPGHDHNGMLDHINDALPSVLAWFTNYWKPQERRSRSRAQSHTHRQPDRGPLTTVWAAQNSQLSERWPLRSLPECRPCHEMGMRLDLYEVAFLRGVPERVVLTRGPAAG